MGAQGFTTIDLGAFPGNVDASVNVTGQAAIVAGSLCEAWLFPAATADHSSDEHIAESPNIRILAGNVVAGTGFTIYAQVGDNPGNGAVNDGGRQGGRSARDGMELYGLWTVAWVWN